MKTQKYYKHLKSLTAYTSHLRLHRSPAVYMKSCSHILFQMIRLRT